MYTKPDIGQSFFSLKTDQGKLDIKTTRSDDQRRYHYRHLPDGIPLAKKNRLPPRLQDFIREHLAHCSHVTNMRARWNWQNRTIQKLMTKFFRTLAPDLDLEMPHNVQMVVKTCQGEFRKTKQSFAPLLRRLLTMRSTKVNWIHQSDLKDLNIIVNTFLTHFETVSPRIQYPELARKTRLRAKFAPQRQPN
jgi:hypothetical protein